MIKEFIVGKLLDEAYDSLKRLLKSNKVHLDIKYSDFERILDKQIQYIVNWCTEISFIDAVRKKETLKTYVKLDYYLTPKKTHYSAKDKLSTINLDQILELENNNIVILGDPGAGKTTTLKYISHQILYNENFYPEKYRFPALIRLKELKESDSLLGKLVSLLGIYVDLNGKELLQSKNEILLSALKQSVSSLRCLILLDGFDEIQTQSLKNKILSEVENISSVFEDTRVILTCRSADFYYNILNFKIYEIKHLEKKQITQFIQNWLMNEEQAKELLNKIQNSTYNYITVKPLTLAHLCAIYERTGEIPPKPILLYKKYIELLLEDWDKQNRVKRTSNFSDFNNEKKLDFLSHLAYLNKDKFGYDYFEKSKLKKIYKEICSSFELPPRDVVDVVNEIENHTGLFLQTGHDSFEFEHKTLQEYITSEYIVKNHKSIPKESLYKFPNELAASLLLDENPNHLFKQILSKIDFFNSYNSFFSEERVDRYNKKLDNHPTLISRKYNFNEKYDFDNMLFSYDELPIPTFLYDFFNTFLSRISLEKVKFESDHELSFWLIAIYTTGSLFKDNNQQLELFSLNTNIYLEKIFKEKYIVNSVKEIERFYKIGLVRHKSENDSFPIYKRSFLPFVLREKIAEELILPKYIYIPISSNENQFRNVLIDKWYIKEPPPRNNKKWEQL